jgi:hypothetical protein
MGDVAGGLVTRLAPLRSGRLCLGPQEHGGFRRTGMVTLRSSRSISYPAWPDDALLALAVREAGPAGVRSPADQLDL